MTPQRHSSAAGRRTNGNIKPYVKLGEAQVIQVRVHKSGRPIIDHALNEYTYPLYFFDYET
jgi:hypothetical protein